MVETKALVAQLAKQAKTYRYYDAYYSGNQPLTYTTKKYRDNFARMLSNYAENLCPAVIEGVNDRLAILGVEVEGSDTSDNATRLWNAWRENRMQRQSKQTHFRSLLSGNSYVIVWPNPRKKFGVDMVLQDAANFALIYDNDGSKEAAVKLWTDADNYAMLTVYYPDRVERWRSTAQIKSEEHVKEETKFEISETIPNPYKEVPVFHFPNSVIDNSGFYGLSELMNIVPVQDALNKAVTDLLVAMEFSAFRQRWATGIEIETDEETGQVSPQFKPGQDRIWATANEGANFGSFEVTELDPFIKVHDMFVLNIARISGTPLHHMLISSTVFPSGEALKTAEARFTGKIEDRQIVFGETWEDVFKFAANIMNLGDIGQVDIKWKLATPRSEKEFVEVAKGKKEFGVSNKMLQREYGYTEKQVIQMEKENKEAMPAPIPATPNNENNNEEEDL